MRYIVRIVKYFIYITLLVCLFLGVLVALKLVSPDPEVMFRNGWDSVWQIAVIFLAFSCIYPRIGFTGRKALAPGEYKELRDTVIDFMHIHSYVLESEDEVEQKMTFRMKNPINRLTRMLEDRITVTRYMSGFELEGPTKDVTRLAYGLESRFAPTDNIS